MTKYTATLRADGSWLHIETDDAATPPPNVIFDSRTWHAVYERRRAVPGVISQPKENSDG